MKIKYIKPTIFELEVEIEDIIASSAVESSITSSSVESSSGGDTDWLPWV